MPKIKTNEKNINWNIIILTLKLKENGVNNIIIDIWMNIK